MKVDGSKPKGDKKKISFSVVKSVVKENILRTEKEMMNSASPSQLPGFGQGLYGQPSNVNSLNVLQQRGFPTGPQPPTASQAPPTSGAQSPSRSLFGNIGQRGILPMTQNMNLASQIKRQTPSSSGILSATAGTATLGGFPRSHAGENQTQFDLADFPSLGNRGSMSGGNALTASRNYVGVMNKPPQETASEFQIQPDDFPALPGKSKMSFVTESGSTNSMDGARKTPTGIIGSGYDMMPKDGKLLGDKFSNNQRKGIQTHSDGTVTNIPQGMVTDQFGMVGLLTFIRAAETDATLVALAPGMDLTTLGLNLNSPEILYSTFQSPWADSPCRPQDIDFHVPIEYLTNIFIREKLAPFKLNRYGENLLFFLFYMNGGDVLQLAAAAELYNRDWRYHKEEKLWITRAIGAEPEVKTNTYERGTYYFFDAQHWRKVMKQFHLEYEKLEDRPQLPHDVLMQQSQTPSAVLAPPH